MRKHVERDTLVITMYKNGSSRKQIAAAAGISVGSVIGVLYRARQRGEVVLDRIAGGNPAWGKNFRAAIGKSETVVKKKGDRDMAIDNIALFKRLEERRKRYDSNFKDIPEEPGGIPIHEFPRNGACRWPVSPGFFCGAAAPLIYCKRHEKRAYNRPVPKPKEGMPNAVEAR